jgi:hypothetical protein
VGFPLLNRQGETDLGSLWSTTVALDVSAPVKASGEPSFPRWYASF